MSTGAACPVPILTFFLPNGQLNAGGYVAPTVGGISTAVYQDAGLTTPLPLSAIPNQTLTGFPLNSYGQPSSSSGASQQVFLPPDVTYTFTVYDQYGNQLYQAASLTGAASAAGGTFTGTGTGFSGAVSFPCTYSVAGNLVTLTIGAATGTSNADTFTMTGLPAALQPPTTAQNLLLSSYNTENDGANLTASSEVLAELAAQSGTITFALNGSASGWNASSTKGFTANQTITYALY